MCNETVDILDFDKIGEQNLENLTVIIHVTYSENIYRILQSETTAEHSHQTHYRGYIIFRIKKKMKKMKISIFSRLF